MAGRVFVVTGANKGIGFQAAKQLCQQVGSSDIVYLTSRNPELGKQAMLELEKENLHPKYHQLDISDKKSIETFRYHLEVEHGGLDVLVNNAAIAYKQASTVPFSEQAAVSVKVNFLGTLDVCDSLFQILKSHARVVHVASKSNCGAWSKLSIDVQKKFADPSLTLKDLKYLIEQFVEAAQTGSHVKFGFAPSAYAMSKIGVTFLGPIHQREFDRNPDNTVVVNTCCPGFCDTDMTSHKGTRLASDGAKVLVHLALLPVNYTGEKGKFWEHRNGSNAVTVFPPVKT